MKRELINGLSNKVKYTITSAILFKVALEAYSKPNLLISEINFDDQTFVLHIL